jgi:hypothetical protein
MLTLHHPLLGSEASFRPHFTGLVSFLLRSPDGRVWDKATLRPDEAKYVRLNLTEKGYVAKRGQS